ncbi:MAG: glycosyltransferase [Propioniciclava sp.]
MADTPTVSRPAATSGTAADQAASPNGTGSTNPLRVSLFTDNYGPSPSGLLYAVHFLEGELLRHGHQVQVVAPQCHGHSPHASHPHRRELRLPSIKFLPGLPMAIASGRGFEAALTRLAQDRPDIIHVHGLGPVGLLGMWAADRLSIPLMVTWHTDFEAYADHYALVTPFADAFYRALKVITNGPSRSAIIDDMRDLIAPRSWGRSNISRRNLLRAARDMLEAADLVTTPSGKTAIRCQELAPDARIQVVPNGVNPLPEGAALPRSSGTRILYAGRIAPEKNISLLLKAFTWVREELPQAELMIVGDWRVGGRLEQKLRRARHQGVSLVGQVPREDLQPYYASADVFAFPSTTDTQALVLHEAAHAGLPLVSCDPELTLVLDEGVNGVIARPTPESLARQIGEVLRAIEDPAVRSRVAQHSRELAAQWTIERQSADIIRLYSSVAAGRRMESHTRRESSARNIPDSR